MGTESRFGVEGQLFQSKIFGGDSGSYSIMYTKFVGSARLLTHKCGSDHCSAIIEYPPSPLSDTAGSSQDYVITTSHRVPVMFIQVSVSQLLQVGSFTTLETVNTSAYPMHLTECRRLILRYS